MMPGRPPAELIYLLLLGAVLVGGLVGFLWMLNQAEDRWPDVGAVLKLIVGALFVLGMFMCSGGDDYKWPDY